MDNQPTTSFRCQTSENQNQLDFFLDVLLCDCLLVVDAPLALVVAVLAAAFRSASSCACSASARCFSAILMRFAASCSCLYCPAHTQTQSAHNQHKKTQHKQNKLTEISSERVPRPLIHIWQHAVCFLLKIGHPRKPTLN